jgi:hypothetical protein
MREIDASGEALPSDKDGPATLHINILEFVGIVVINIWLVTGLLRHEGARTGGHVISVLADNTSALSWLRH